MKPLGLSNWKDLPRTENGDCGTNMPRGMCKAQLEKELDQKYLQTAGWGYQKWQQLGIKGWIWCVQGEVQAGSQQHKNGTMRPDART